MLLNMASKVFCRVILERIKMALDKELRGVAGGVSNSSELYGPDTDTENYCRAEYRVAVPLVHQLYRLRKGLQ